MRNNENPKPEDVPDQKTPDQESDFVVKTKTKENVQKDERLNLLELEKEEIKNNLGDFKEDDRRIMEKYVNGEEMTPGEKKQIFMIKSEWWKKTKYCYDTEEQTAYLKKNRSSKEQAETSDMQIELIEAFRVNDGKKIAELRQKYETKFNGQIEGVEALLNLNDYFKEDQRVAFLKNKTRLNRNEIDRMKKEAEGLPEESNEKYQLKLKINRLKYLNKGNHAEMRKLIPELAGYQSLLGDFIKNNLNNREFLANFWEVVEQIGIAKGNPVESKRLQAGVLSQVAIVHTMEYLGYQPHIVHPEEDAFKKIDLKLGDEDILQIKGTPDEMQMLETTDVVTIPGSKIEGPDGIKYVTDFLARQFSDFKVGMNKLEKEMKEKNNGQEVNLKAYMIAIPHNEFDPITGNPSQKFKDFMEKNFGRNPQKKDAAPIENPA